jgi:polygalacturonase
MRTRYLGALALVCGCSAGSTAGNPGAPPDASPVPLDSGVREGGVTVDAAGPGDAGADGAGGGDVAADAALRVCDVKQYGAKGDGVTKDTAAIQAAIDDCAATGGEVELEGGVFLSGMIVLASHVTLDVEASATLLGSQDIADYPDRAPPVVNTQLADCKKALVYAESADDVHIRGSGTIDGNATGVADWNGDVVPPSGRW